jgi:hypothetical protein
MAASYARADSERCCVAVAGSGMRAHPGHLRDLQRIDRGSLAEYLAA